MDGRKWIVDLTTCRYVEKKSGRTTDENSIEEYRFSLFTEQFSSF